MKFEILMIQFGDLHNIILIALGGLVFNCQHEFKLVDSLYLLPLISGNEISYYQCTSLLHDR